MMYRKIIAALICLALCLCASASLAGPDYQWTADDYIWSFQSKRVNDIPIGDALEYAYSDASWQAGVANDGSGDVLGVFQGYAGRQSVMLMVRFTSYFSFTIERGELDGAPMDDPSQCIVDALQTYLDDHICPACAGLGYVDTCLNCAGSGYAYGKTCLACGGSGMYDCNNCSGYGAITTDYTRSCPFCDGTGSGGVCATCGGSGYEMVSGMLMMCTSCMGSGEQTCSYCSSGGMIKLGYLTGS